MLGLGVYRPERIVTNDEICEVLDSTDEWIQSRSGIRTRRFAGDGRDAHRHGDHRGRAGARRVRRGRRADRLRHRRHLDAPRAHARLRARRSRPRSGRPRRRSTSPPAARASATRSTWRPSMVRAGAETHVLVIGVEQLSRFMDPTDRGTAFIFADGAGAVVVGPADADRDRPDRLGLGRLAGPRHQPDPQLPRRPRSRRPTTRSCRWRARRSSAGRPSRWPRWPTRRWPAPASRSTTSTPSSRTRPTCASPRPCRRNIKLPESVAVATDIVDSGNTSAASVPAGDGGHAAQGRGQGRVTSPCSSRSAPG